MERHSPAERSDFVELVELRDLAGAASEIVERHTPAERYDLVELVELHPVRPR